MRLEDITYFMLICRRKKHAATPKQLAVLLFLTDKIIYLDYSQKWTNNIRRGSEIMKSIKPQHHNMQFDPLVYL